MEDLQPWTAWISLCPNDNDMVAPFHLIFDAPSYSGFFELTLDIMTSIAELTDSNLHIRRHPSMFGIVITDLTVGGLLMVVRFLTSVNVDWLF